MIKGGYGTILADCPWSFNDKGTRLAPEGSVNGYQTMKLSDIRQLPLNELGAKDSHLYLWCPDQFLAPALDLIGHWGYRFIQLIPWVKVDAKGQPRVGGGHYFRHVYEPLLFAVRGKVPVPRHDLRGIMVTTRGAHSAKPDEQYPLIEAMSPGPRIELFARRARTGWVAWGNEAPKAP